MKLTEKQNEALVVLHDDKSLPINNNKVNKKTMNSLYFKGLVKLPRYANGEFWELTDKGLNYINHKILFFQTNV